MNRRLVILIVGPLLALLGVTAAWAYWSTTGTGTASASTGTLNAPGKPAGTDNLGTVDLTWVKSTVSGGGTITYSVERRNQPGSTWVPACTPPVVDATNVTCNDASGAGSFVYRVTAAYNSWTARSADSNTVTVANPAATSLAISAPATATAGTGFSFTVTAKTAANATATAYTGRVTFTSSDPQALLPAAYTFTVADNGVHVFSGAALRTAGSRTIVGTDAAGITGSTSVSVSAGAPATVSALSGTPQSTTVNTAFGSALTAKVTDSFGNAVSGASVQFTAPASGASGRFANSTPTTTIVSDAAGAVTAALTANTTAGSYTVVATATGAATASFSLTNASGVANKLTFAVGVSGNQTATATATIGPFAVQAQDTFGNPVTTGSSVTLTLSSTSAGTKFFTTSSGGSTTGSVTIAAGASTSSNFYYADTSAGTPTLTASATINSVAATPASTSGFTIVSLAANKLAFTTVASGNQTATATATIGPFAVQAQDTFGNPVTTGSSVTLTLSSTSAGTKFFTTSSGGSTAGSVTIAALASTSSAFYYADTKAGSPTLTASATVNSVVMTSATTSFTVVGAAAKLVFTAEVSGNRPATSTATIGPFTVQAQDLLGNAVVNTGSAATLTLSSSSNGTYFFTTTSGGSSAVAVTIASGASVSSNFYYADGRAGSPVLTAAGTVNSAAMLSATTSGFTVVAGAANKLGITGPSSGPATSTTTPLANLGPFTVQLQDQFGNAVAAAGNITVNLGKSTGAGNGATAFATSLNGTPITALTLGFGQSSVNFYFGYTKANTTPVITATAVGLGIGTLQVTINP